MVHWKDRQFFEPQITRLSALVFCHMVDLLFLTHLVQGQSQVMGQPQPLVAMAGNNVVLPCQLEPAVDAISLTVEWARADLKPRFVLLRRGGVNLLIDQNPSYIGRASVSINKLKRGDLSLTLTKVKLSDAGTYRCIVPQQATISEVKLTVETKMLHGEATELEELQRPTGAEGESLYLESAKKKKADLYRSIEDLDEALEKNEDELTTVIDSLREFKSNLKKQKESVNEILMEMTEKRTAMDEKDKKKRGEGKAAKVKRRKATRKDILQNADELMETTENIIVSMSEMRVRLENNQKQVNKQLMETKKLYLDQQSPTERQ